MNRRAAVLVVHNQPCMRTSLCWLLSSVGHDVHQAAAGDDALALLAAHDLDLVVTDARLWPMRGDELTRQMRQRRPDLEFIWTTSYASRAAFDAALRLRVFDYIEVPFDCERFLAGVEHLLQRRRQRRRYDGGVDLGPHLSELCQRVSAVEEANPLRRWRRRTQTASTIAAQQLGVDVATLKSWECGEISGAALDRAAAAIGEP